MRGESALTDFYVKAAQIFWFVFRECVAFLSFVCSFVASASFFLFFSSLFWFSLLFLIAAVYVAVLIGHHLNKKDIGFLVGGAMDWTPKFRLGFLWFLWVFAVILGHYISKVFGRFFLRLSQHHRILPTE